MCRYFSGLIQQDNIADRQAVAMIIHGLSTVEFLIQLLQQFRLRNAALSGRKIATVENLVIINPFLADSPMRSSRMPYSVLAPVDKSTRVRNCCSLCIHWKTYIFKSMLCCQKQRQKMRYFSVSLGAFVFFQISAYKKRTTVLGLSAEGCIVFVTR